MAGSRYLVDERSTAFYVLGVDYLRSDFLLKLAERTLGKVLVPEPAVVPRFEPNLAVHEGHTYIRETENHQQGQSQQPTAPSTPTSNLHPGESLPPQKTSQELNPYKLLPKLPERRAFIGVIEPEKQGNPTSKKKEDSVREVPHGIVSPTNANKSHDFEDGSDSRSVIETAEPIRIQEKEIADKTDGQNPRGFPLIESAKNAPSPLIAPPQSTREVLSEGELTWKAEASEPGSLSSAPIVRVSIGRIEVRSSPSPTPQHSLVPTPPALSLDEYLRRREGGQE